MAIIRSRIETITPEGASKLLEKNTLNRSIRENLVDAYAKDMKSGMWKTNGKTIVIADTGRVLDGQHRLWACVMSDTAFETNVCRGVDESTFDTIDTGINRNSGDIFGIAGVTNSQHIASAVRWIYRYVNGLIRSKCKVSSRDLLERYQKLSGVDLGLPFGRKLKAFAPPAMWAALWWLLQQADPDKGAEFCNAFLTDEWETGHGPIKAAKKRIVEIALAKHPAPPEERLAIVIKGWNAFYQGRDVRAIKLTRTESFPVIDGLDPKTLSNMKAKSVSIKSFNKDLDRRIKKKVSA
jgi:hypothetical protein